MDLRLSNLHQRQNCGAPTRLTRGIRWLRLRSSRVFGRHLVPRRCQDTAPFPRLRRLRDGSNIGFARVGLSSKWSRRNAIWHLFGNHLRGVWQRALSHFRRVSELDTIIPSSHLGVYRRRRADEALRLLLRGAISWKRFGLASSRETKDDMPLCNVGQRAVEFDCRYSSEAQCRDHSLGTGAGRLRKPKRICAGRLGKQDLCLG